MSYIKFIRCFTIILACINAHSQSAVTFTQPDTFPLRSCHTREVLEYHISKGDITYNENKYEKQLQKWIDNYKINKSKWRTEDDTLIIPVIVHIVHNGENVGTSPNITATQVYSQFDVLNEDFNKKLGTLGYNNSTVGASMKIKFVKAVWAPDGSELAEHGIRRYNGNRTSWSTVSAIENILKPATQWNPNNYLNIWTVKLGGTLSKTLGYAQFPSLSTLQGLDANEGPAVTDGLVIRYNVFGRVGDVVSPYNKGRTVTHEMGHFLGLKHIWGDDSNCSTTTDYCDDTPKVNAENYRCPTAPIPACISGQRAMTENYLDYTDDVCMNIFTNDQKSRVLAVLANSPRRKELLSSNVYIASLKPQAFIGCSTKIACAGNVVNFIDSSKMAPTSWQWMVKNSLNNIVISTTSQNFSHTFTATGAYSLQLIVTNTHGADTAYKANYLHIISGNTLTMPFTENFETNTVLSRWVLYNPAADSTWRVLSGVSAYGTGQKCYRYNNYDSTYDKTGIKNGIVSPKIAFASGSNSYLEFDYAYAKYQDYADTLSILYSTDCGKTFKTFWKRGGDNLATGTPKSTQFLPTNTEWRKEQISLQFLNGQPSVHLMFQNISGWGNAIYLDNINIHTPIRTAPPVADFYAAPTTVCQGQSVTFADISTQYPTGWSWNITEKNNGATPITSTQQYLLIIFNISGTYHVSLTTQNALGTSSALTKNNYIKVNTPPQVSILTSTTLLGTCNPATVLTATGAQHYKWYDYKGTQVVGNQATLAINPSLSAIYTVYGTDANGCVNSAFVEIEVQDTCLTSLNNNINNTSWILYPNPAEDLLYIYNTRGYYTKTTLHIYDVYGKMVMNKAIDNSIMIDLSKISQGIYFVHIEAPQGINNIKFIKQ
ncbi:MAG: M43 family zinc metalloprotease [Cytophagales bacterium]|nr:M43 family zinc metalloprotease [Cytophagales bacterium]